MPGIAQAANIPSPLSHSADSNSTIPTYATRSLHYTLAAILNFSSEHKDPQALCLPVLSVSLNVNLELLPAACTTIQVHSVHVVDAHDEQACHLDCRGTNMEPD